MRLAQPRHGAAWALVAYLSRTWLTWLAVALGTAAVVALSARGEGARRHVLDDFAGLGTQLPIVFSERNETTGGPPPLLAETPRNRTLGEALALLRSRHIEPVAPLSIGSAPVSPGVWSGRSMSWARPRTFWTFGT